MKISIITISLNSEKTIRKTIESIVSQDMGDAELEYIIIDGKSSDGTMDIVKSFGDAISRVVSEPDDGIADAFNKGIKMATGDVIGIINSDDQLTPGALKAVAEAFDDETDVVFGNILRVHKDGSEHENKACPDPGRLKSGMAMCHQAVYIRRSAHEKYGLYDKSCRYVMDRELLLRMYLGGAKFRYIDVCLARYYDGGVSNRHFFSGVLPEHERVSVKYGMTPAKARLHRIKEDIRMRGVFFVKKLRGQR